MKSEFISGHLLKAVLECEYDLITTTQCESDSDLMIMSFNNYMKASNEIFKVEVITDVPYLQDRKVKKLSIGYVLQLCDDWARYHNFLVINDLDKFRVIRRDALELIYTEDFLSKQSFEEETPFYLDSFKIFKGYEYILRNLINK